MGRPVVPVSHSNEVEHRRQIANAINLINRSSSDSIDLSEYGPAGGGVTDDTASVKAWAADAVDNSRLTATGIFRLESTVTDPGTGIANQHGVLFTGLTGLVLDLSAATFVQTVASSGAVIGGVIALKDCIDCTVIVRSTGYNDVSAGLESAASVALIGACTGCTVIGIQKGGGRSGVIVRSDDLTNAGSLPANCRVISFADGSTRACVTSHVGAGMHYEILAKDCHRSFFVDGAHGPGYANVVTDGDTTSAIRLRADGAGSVIDGLEIDAALNNCQAAQLSIASSSTSGEKGIVRSVKIRGYGSKTNSGVGGASIGITEFNDASSELIDLDLSEYTCYHDKATTQAVVFQPDNASGVIKNFRLPRVISGDNCAQNHVLIDNTAGASIDGLKFADVIAGAAAGTWQCAQITGAVKNVDLAGTRLEQAGGSSSFSVQGANCDGVNLVGAISTRGVMGFQGSTRVIASPARIAQGGTEGPIVTGALTDAAQMAGVTTWISSTGSATVNELNWGHIGQQVTILATGGTQTLVHSAQLIMISGANVVLGTDADSVVMVCTDETPGTQVWRQVA